MDNFSNAGISVVLCTFNGELFIKEQLESIARQTLLPAELVLSDDHSSDQTLSIAEDFSARSPFPVRIICNKKQLGIIENFSQALLSCKGDYITLCDQDDIWLPGKLETDYLGIKKAEHESIKTTPLLIHSDLIPVDSFGNEITISFMRIRNIHHTNQDPLKKLLVQNFVTGSTTMINRAVLDIALPIPSAAIVHDWWLALIAAATGKIVFNNQTNILYRQHSNNVLGAKPYYSTNTIFRLFNLTKLDKEYAASLKQAESLLGRVQMIEGISYPSYLDSYLACLKKGGLQACLYTYKNNITKYGLIRIMIQLLIILRKQYLDYL